ncbi:uncharacterized protein [Mycetomoellerius zeteki]|uniref:uncharacterized protein n=1 Tax=Mycetomoellerius zeteki TaxID=64791 RepID=UPI00084E8AA3|nr:PREDICTED: uncharacterized protein LOC108731637 [Trachymyrmex zeteki]
MKLLALILALSCVIACTVAQNREQRKIDLNTVKKYIPIFNADAILKFILFGQKFMVGASSKYNVPASETQPNSESNNLLNEDNSPSVSSSQVLPLSSNFRWRRKAVEPFRIEAQYIQQK